MKRRTMLSLLTSGFVVPKAVAEHGFLEVGTRPPWERLPVLSGKCNASLPLAEEAIAAVVAIGSPPGWHEWYPSEDYSLWTPIDPAKTPPDVSLYAVTVGCRGEIEAFPCVSRNRAGVLRDHLKGFRVNLQKS